MCFLNVKTRSLNASEVLWETPSKFSSLSSELVLSYKFLSVTVRVLAFYYPDCKKKERSLNKVVISNCSLNLLAIMRFHFLWLAFLGFAVFTDGNRGLSSIPNLRYMHEGEQYCGGERESRVEARVKRD